MAKQVGTFIRNLDVCGISFPVIRATPEEVPTLASESELLDGFFDAENGRIVIRKGLSPSLERDAIAHEAMHAFLYTSGLQELMKQAMGEKKFRGFEEVLVRVATPHLSKFFASPKPAKSKKPTSKPMFPSVAKAAKRTGKKRIA